MRMFTLLLLARAAAAQTQIEAVPVVAAVRAAIRSPAASGALVGNPGLAVVPTLRLENPSELRALTPLLSRLPANFAETASPALLASDPARTHGVVAAIERAYSSAQHAVFDQLVAREAEMRTLSPGREAADAWRALAAEAAPLELYGPRVAERVRAVEAAAEAAERAARAQAEAERIAQALASDPAAELERVAVDSKRWAGFAGLADAARLSVHATNAPPEAKANLEAARKRGVHVELRYAPDVPHQRIVVDNRELVEFDAEGRVAEREEVLRGWILADGTFLTRQQARAARDSAKAYLARMSRDEEENIIGQRLNLFIKRLCQFVAGFSVAGMLLVLAAPLKVALTAIICGLIGSMAILLLSRRDEELAEAAHLGWTLGSVSKAPPPWERILGDLAYDSANPYSERLAQALAPFGHAAIPAQFLAPLLAQLSGPVWRPYLRGEHLGLIWRQLASPDPLAVALAAQFLTSANSAFLASHLETRPDETALLSVYERLFPEAARSLRAEVAALLGRGS